MAKRQYVLVEFGWCVAWVIASIVADNKNMRLEHDNVQN